MRPVEQIMRTLEGAAAVGLRLHALEVEPRLLVDLCGELDGMLRMTPPPTNPDGTRPTMAEWLEELMRGQRSVTVAGPDGMVRIYAREARR